MKSSLEVCFKLRTVLKLLWRSQTVSHKEEQKHTLRETYINKDCENVTKFMKITSNSTHERQRRQKAHNDKKTGFLNELVEHADLHKPVLNKIKTTDE